MSGAELAFVKVAIRAVFSYAFPSQARKPVCTNDIISLKSTITNSFECRRSVTPNTREKASQDYNYFNVLFLLQVKYKKHKRANNTNGKPSSNPNTPGPPQPPSSTSMIDPFRRPKSESSGGIGGILDNKYIISTSPTITSVPSITTLPPVTSPAPMEMYTNPNKGLLGGVNILRAALTGSNDVSQIGKSMSTYLDELLLLFTFFS